MTWRTRDLGPGLLRAPLAHWPGCMQKQTGKLFAVVTQSNRDLEPLERDLRFWYCALAGKTDCNNEVLLLPASESDPYAGSSPHAETLEQRALTLWRLVRHSQDFVLLTARALARRMWLQINARAGALLNAMKTHSTRNLSRIPGLRFLREDTLEPS